MLSIAHFVHLDQSGNVVHNNKLLRNVKNMSKLHTPISTIREITISVGQYKNRPKCERLTVTDLCGMNDRPQGEETWWSGNLWRTNYRTNANWESLTVAMVDLDYDQDVPIVPDDVRAKIVLEELPGDILYHTPHGLRAGFVLSKPCTDVDLAERYCRGSGRAVLAALAEQGVDGFHLDPVSAVKAQLFFSPNAIAKGVARQFVAVKGRVLDEALLLELGEAPLVREPEANDKGNISAALAKMDCEGPGDGSAELICVAAKAIRLGIRDASEFLEVVEKWNKKRKNVRWSDDDLVKRFTDAYLRWEGLGLVPVPEQYKRYALQSIVEGDCFYKHQFVFDEIDGVVLYNAQPVDMDGHILSGIEVQISKRYGYATVPRETLMQAIVLVAVKRRVNRVQQYLSELLPWDGVERIPVLLDALRVTEHRDLAAQYVRKTLIAACARAISPGCKHDHMLVLVGPEGAKKSMSIAALAGPRNFADSRLDLESQEANRNIRPFWIYEWSELEATTRKADVARVKNFLSSASDVVRDPYDRKMKNTPRRGIFIGSTNSRDFLRDPDSNRRFWPIEIGAGIDVDAILLARDQIWAEHLAAYAHGEPWWLDPTWEAIRATTNKDFEPDEPMFDRLEEELAKLGTQFMTRDLYIRLGLDPSGKHYKEGAILKTRLYTLGFVHAKIILNGHNVNGYKKRD